MPQRRKARGTLQTESRHRMKNFLVTDFEFTQYTRPVGKPRGFFSEIIEVGAVLMEGAPLAVTAKLQHFVKPHFYPKQAKEAMDFCMITAKDMKKAIAFEAMLEALTALYTPGQTWFVAWGGEDYHVIQRGCDRRGIPNPIQKADYLDLAEAYRLFKGDNYTTGLKKATEEQEVPMDGIWHTAFDDAANTGKLLKVLMEQRGWSVELYAQQAAAALAAKEQAAKEKHDAWLERSKLQQHNKPKP